MSMSVSVVCLSVCPRGYLRNHTRDLYRIFMHVAYGHGSVLLRQVDEIQRVRGNFGGFLPQWQYIVQHSIWDPCKYSWTDRDAVWNDEWAWSEEQCIMWGDDPRKERSKFGENMCTTNLIPLLIANWTGSCSGTRPEQTLDCKRWTSLSLAAKWGLGLHTAGEVWYLRFCLVNKCVS